jgi:hypothetical protein
MGIFAGSVQALIFSTLAAAYIAKALEFLIKLLQLDFSKLYILQFV